MKTRTARCALTAACLGAGAWSPVDCPTWKLLTVRVRWSLFSGYRYELRNARGDVVANAVADQTARRVCISPPAGTGQPIATFALQGASDGVACWGFELLVPGVVPADAWPILAAYFAHDRDVYEAHEQLVARWEAERQRVAAQAERRADADFYQVIADLAQHAVSGIFDPEDTSEPTSDTESTGTPQWPPPLRFPERERQQFEAPLRTQPAAPHRPRSSMPVRSRPADDGRPGVHGRIRTKMTEAMQSFASLPDDDQAVKDSADEIVEELRVYCRHLPDDQALRGGIGLLQAFMDVTYESAQWQPQAP